MLPLEHITVGTALKNTVKKYPNRSAIEYRGTVWTYLELDRLSDHLAAGFLTAGVSRGTHVGIWSELNAELLLTYYALQKIGAVTVLLSTALSLDAMLGQLKQTDCEWLVAGSLNSAVDMHEVCAAAEKDGVSVVRMCRDFVADGFSLRTIDTIGSGMSMNVLLAEMAQVCPEDPSMILFTSGTNSKPKAVVSTHYARINNGIQQADDLHATCEDRFCVMLPMFHCFSISTNILAAPAASARLRCGGLPPDADIRPQLAQPEYWSK